MASLRSRWSSDRLWREKTGRLSGIIDFGQVSLDTPINDLAKWDYWEAPTLPVAWLQEGYADKRLFDRAYPERFRALRIAPTAFRSRSWRDFPTP